MEVSRKVVTSFFMTVVFLAAFTLNAFGDLYLDSSDYPIRVYYADGQLELAENILEAGENAWDRQIDQLGFSIPWTGVVGGEPEQGMWFTIEDTGMGADAAMVDWVSDVPSTDQCDCSAIVIIDENTSPDSSDLPETVFHEFYHATQYADDCTEPPSAYEGPVIAYTADEFPNSPTVPWVIEQFQSFPEYPLDYWTRIFPGDGTAPNFAYQLGVGLFFIYLKERFGDDDPVFLGELFQAAEQSGTTTVGPPHPSCSNPNHPNWFEGIDEVLSQQESGFQEAFVEFSSWRVIVGENADDAHLANAGQYEPCAVADILGPDLPASGELDVYEYGSRVIEILLPENSSYPLMITIDADNEASWAASLISWSEEGSAQIETFHFSQGYADLVFDPEDVIKAALVVSQLDDGVHDLDLMDYSDLRTFYYTVERYYEDDDDEGCTGDDSDSDGGSSSDNDDACCG